ncbi:MAG: RnfABCDGE type electron transport complex subunit G [Thermodesulfobacteriota bacterium]|nr:RnfABCDGE type electron transport complex subunit G [Thermodesulfobacteriota bacterium]
MKELFKLTVVLTIICSLAATALALVYTITKEPIAHQQRLKKLRAIKAVQPDYDNESDQDFIDLKTDESAEGDGGLTRFYITKKGDTPTGVVFMTSAVGYGGLIDLMVGVNPEGTITGVQVLRHTETPGLGAKITEDTFIQQFPERNLQNTNWALKKEGGDIDQISGATISPQAVVKALNQGLTFFSDNQDKILGAG